MVGSQAILPESSRIVVALGFAALVWAAASPSFSGLPVWRPLVVLGAASYAIYLVHNPALSILVRLLPAGTSIGVAYVAIAMGALMPCPDCAAPPPEPTIRPWLQPLSRTPMARFESCLACAD